MNEDPRPKDPRPKTTTRRGNGAGHGGLARGAGLWGEANGRGWGGPSRASGQARACPMTADERDSLRREMVGLYVEIARDPEQSAMVRMAAAEHLLERLDNPFDRSF
jgi:hypothetical protein